MGDLWEDASFLLGKGGKETGVPDGEKHINQDLRMGESGRPGQEDSPGKPDTAVQGGFEKLCEGFGFHHVEDTEEKDTVVAVKSAANVEEGAKRSPEAEKS